MIKFSFQMQLLSISPKHIYTTGDETYEYRADRHQRGTTGCSYTSEDGKVSAMCWFGGHRWRGTYRGGLHLAKRCLYFAIANIKCEGDDTLWWGAFPSTCLFFICIFNLHLKKKPEWKCRKSRNITKTFLCSAEVEKLLCEQNQKMQQSAIKTDLVIKSWCT